MVPEIPPSIAVPSPVGNIPARLLSWTEKGVETIFKVIFYIQFSSSNLITVSSYNQ